jgi:hypothetical protein
MKIIIPMSGIGKRFMEAGYPEPKPLIIVEGKTIIEHVINFGVCGAELKFEIYNPQKDSNLTEEKKNIYGTGWYDYVTVDTDMYNVPIVTPTELLKQLVNTTDSDGLTPLYFAAKYSSTEIISTIIKAGAILSNRIINNSPLDGLFIRRCYNINYGDNDILFGRNIMLLLDIKNNSKTMIIQKILQVLISNEYYEILINSILVNLVNIKNINTLVCKIVKLILDNDCRYIKYKKIVN